MVDGGPIDVLTGDWLAELTMLILARTRAKHPGAGYARTFVTQMEEVMGSCLDRGIKVVSNAGGLDPQACAEAVAQVATTLGSLAHHRLRERGQSPAATERAPGGRRGLRHISTPTSRSAICRGSSVRTRTSVASASSRRSTWVPTLSSLVESPTRRSSVARPPGVIAGVPTTSTR